MSYAEMKDARRVYDRAPADRMVAGEAREPSVAMAAFGQACRIIERLIVAGLRR
jgi:hypothetical protein